MVWAIWLDFADSTLRIDPKPNFQSIDQRMSMSDAALKYGCEIGESVPFNGLTPNPLFFLMRYPLIPPQELETAFRYLYNMGYDIEERNCEQATLLLFAASQFCPSVISILRFLIEKEADLRAVDLINRGALHCALRAPEDWGAWDSSCTDGCDHYEHGHEDWAYFKFCTESELYAEDYCDDGLTPVLSVIDDIQSDKLPCDDEIQERPYRTLGRECSSTTGSTRSRSRSSRSRSGQYIDLDEAEDVDDDYEEDVEDHDEEEDMGENIEDNEDNEDDGDDEALEIPEGYAVCNDVWGIPRIIRKPLLVLKTRLRFKLLTLLRAGCDPNHLDVYDCSPSDDARYHGLWLEWTWALLNAGYVFDEDSDCWVKRVEDELSSGP